MLHKISQLKKEAGAKKASGFTIIEVMIVLAIAGFIMGIVFVAIPQLQRNSRNSAREADALLLGASMADCLSNKNGVIASCDSWAEVTPFADAARLKQLTGTPLLVASGAAVGAAYTVPAGVTTTVAQITTAAKCNASTDGAVGALPREYAVLYQVETTSGTTYRCIGS